MEFVLPRSKQFQKVAHLSIHRITHAKVAKVIIVWIKMVFVYQNQLIARLASLTVDVQNVAMDINYRMGNV